YRSKWFLTPRQHVVEALGSVILLLPALVAGVAACQRELARRPSKADPTFRRVGPVHKVWAYSLLVSVLVGAWMKLQSDHIGSHPMFLWQPCHTHSVVLAATSLVDAQWARAVFHVAVTLWWGPFLALVAPDLPSEPIHIALFYIQHVLMMAA
ncbi:unnamed protein product, partial [Phaeothamnion confervicola]